MMQSPILAAFASAQAAYRSLFQLPDEATDEEAEVFHVVIDAARLTMQAEAARTPAEAAAKLRIGLQGVNQTRDGSLAALGLGELIAEEDRHECGMPDSDTFEKIIWSAILDLEKQGEAA